MKKTQIICPLCGDKVEKLLYRYHLDGERRVIDVIRQRHPSWTEKDGWCSRCMDFYQAEIVMQQKIMPGIGPYFPVRSADDFIILPTGLRLDADQRFTGKGITICLIDSGFYPHPDLTRVSNRIKACIDITTGENINEDQFSNAGTDAWHGTMTSVVCAGDGYLSQGLYKSLAPDANLVLLKVQDREGRITAENIAKALEWILVNHRIYQVRIVNISLGTGGQPQKDAKKIETLTAQLAAEGIIIVAAAGNNTDGQLTAPASSPDVLTVGGSDDSNELMSTTRLYHSTFGQPSEAIAKPELLAPAIWIAAPILPGSNEQTESQLLHHLLSLNEDELPFALTQNCDVVGIDPSAIPIDDAVAARDLVISRIQSRKFISPNYMHVDGTSFAAPIICSVIAQLLEVNQHFTPAKLRSLLFDTARRVPGYPSERQGYGEIRARDAVLAALRSCHDDEPLVSPVINSSNNTITFSFEHYSAKQVAVAGNFNEWNGASLLLEPQPNGRWSIEIPALPAGKYAYKFLVDQQIWREDTCNPWREPDGLNGFNSILFIKNELWN